MAPLLSSCMPKLTPVASHGTFRAQLKSHSSLANGSSVRTDIHVSRSKLSLQHETKNGTAHVTPSSVDAASNGNAHLVTSPTKDDTAALPALVDAVNEAPMGIDANENNTSPNHDVAVRNFPLESDDRSVLWNLLGPDELQRVLPGGKLSIKIISWNRCSNTMVLDAWNLINTLNTATDGRAESEEKLTEELDIKLNGDDSPQLSRRTFVIHNESKSHVSIDSGAATSPLPHCIVISCQEFSFSTAFQQRWESALQAAIGLAHVKFFSDNVNGLHTVIFLQRELIWYTSVPRSRKIILRSLNTVRSKALLSITFALFRTTLRFTNCHFSAGETESQRRSRLEDHDELQKYVTIDPVILSNSNKNNIRPVLAQQQSVNSGKQTEIAKPVTLRDGFNDVDYAFCYGDLNFRLNQQRHIVLETIEHIQRHEHYRQNVHNLLEWDELKALMKSQRVFPRFSEPQIEFAPTYKYDLNTDTYDTSNKQRCPAFCDRILFRCNNTKRFDDTGEADKTDDEPNNSILCQNYSRIDNVRSSDHRPIYATFTITIKPVNDDYDPELTASLYHNYSAGLFDRQVYAQSVRDMCAQQQQTRAANVRGGRRASTTIAARRLSNTDGARSNGTTKQKQRDEQQQNGQLPLQAQKSMVTTNKKHATIPTAFEQQQQHSSSLCVIQ